MTPLEQARVASAAALSELKAGVVDGRDAFTVDDSLVLDTVRRLDQSGVFDRVTAWVREDARGPGGAPEKFTKQALITIMFVTARLGRPMLLTEWLRVVRCMTPEARTTLGFPEPPDPAARRHHLAYYRNLRTRFHAIERLIDFSPVVKNRRLSPDELARRSLKRMAELTPERVAVLRERQEWFINRILRMSVRAVPQEMLTRWGGGLAVDATPVATFARGPRKKGRPRRGHSRPTITESADPDSGWYVRQGDHADVDFLPDGSRADKVLFGFEHTHVYLCAAPDERGMFPKLVVAMPLPHLPGEAPGHNGRRAVELAALGLEELGITTDRATVAADNAYVNARPEHFAIPLRSMGIDLLIDYNSKQLGIQGGFHGALLVEGWWYCPAMPSELVNATADHRAKRIDDATYARLIEERRAFEFRMKERPRPDGSIRLMCPASGAATTARCSHKKQSLTKANLGKRRVDLNHLLETEPPRVCRQESIVIPAEERGRFEQRLRLGSARWTKMYKTFRSTNEGGNGITKDPAFQDLEEPKRRRVRGQAANALITCFMICAANLVQIASWAQKATPDSAGVPRLGYFPRSSRRPIDLALALPADLSPPGRPA